MKTNHQQAIKDHRELEIYKKAFDTAMEIFQLSQKFPVEERYSLTDQIRRSSRSVCANLAEAWRKRRYKAARTSHRGEGASPPVSSFIAKLNDCEAVRASVPVRVAAETQTWLEFKDAVPELGSGTLAVRAVKCNYMEIEAGRKLYGTYHQVIAGLVSMINNPTPWLIKR